MDVDFCTLLNLAEQRRGRVNDTHDTPQAVPAATLPATLPATCPTRPARARKVSVMPSPDDHFLSLERERRAGRTGRSGKHETLQMRTMSPTSPTSEVVTCLRDSVLRIADALHMLRICARSEVVNEFKDFKDRYR